MYESADKYVKLLNRMFIKEFTMAKNKLPKFDELHTIHSASAMYQRMYSYVKEYFLKIAIDSYREGLELLDSPLSAKKSDVPDRKWVSDFFVGYDKLTAYVFEHEVDRKASRFAESVIATDYMAKMYDTALRLWANQVAQYAINITDMALLKAYLDNGVKKIKWVTTLDDRTCKVCEARNGNIYPINKIPLKPHIGCRCYYLPVED